MYTVVLSNLPHGKTFNNSFGHLFVSLPLTFSVYLGFSLHSYLSFLSSGIYLKKFLNKLSRGQFQGGHKIRLICHFFVLLRIKIV